MVKVITQSGIDYLFDSLWPMMAYSQQHKKNCTQQFTAIESYFIKYGNNFNDLLLGLSSLNGIGLTIASGLIWSVYDDEAVPFDRYTMTYAIYKNILLSNKISNNRYTNACVKITNYTTSNKMTIEEFVIEALDEIITNPNNYPAFIEPE